MNYTYYVVKLHIHLPLLPQRTKHLWGKAPRTYCARISTWWTKKIQASSKSSHEVGYKIHVKILFKKYTVCQIMSFGKMECLSAVTMWINFKTWTLRVFHKHLTWRYLKLSFWLLYNVRWPNLHWKITRQNRLPTCLSVLCLCPACIHENWFV